MAKPTPEQINKINALAATALNPEEVFVHEYLMIGTKYIPSRKMQFDRSLLEVYLQNLKNADVVQIANHDFSGCGEGILPYGRFFDGEIRDDGESAGLYGTRYMVSGLPTYIKAFTTDDINRMIDAGILKDSSVSVSWGFSQCSICGNDIRDYENCNHWPGGIYKRDGKEIECRVIAKPAQAPKVDNSAMLENSDVVAGAYEDARVNPKKPFSANGEKPPNTEKMVNLNNIADLKLVNKDAPVFCCLSSTSATFQIESENLRDVVELHQMHHDMYQLEELPEGWTKARLSAEHKKDVQALLDAGYEHFLVDALDGALNEALKAKSTKGSDNMPNEIEAKLTLDVEKLTAQLKEMGDKSIADLAVKETEIVTLKTKVDELTPLADLGTKYREDVIETALKSGVRDQGNEFKEDTFKKMFANLSIEEIQEMGQAWETSALAKLGAPEGHTKGEDLKLPGEGLKQTIDPELYKVGR